MSLLDTLRAGIAIADSITKPLQCLVDYRHYTGTDAYGSDLYIPPEGEPAIKILAIVDWKQKQLRTMEGTLSVSRASVMFLNVWDVSAATNNQGINDNDIIVLPDGTTGPILDMAGFIDAGTGQPMATEVFLG